MLDDGSDDDDDDGEPEDHLAAELIFPGHFFRSLVFFSGTDFHSGLVQTFFSTAQKHLLLFFSIERQGRHNYMIENNLKGSLRVKNLL